jgi:hypothetical protein
MEKLVKQVIKKYSLKKTANLPKNLILKVVSLSFAVFLWYFVVGEDKIDTTIYVPIEIINLRQDLVISNQFRKQIEVTVNGPRGLVRSVASQNITRPVDLTNALPGSHLIKNTPESIKLPNGIQIQNIRPANITLLIDRLLEKRLPIKPLTTGSPATGYEVAALVANPPSLDLTAPATTLEKEEFLPTEPIDVTGRESSFNTQVPLAVGVEITELIGEPVITVNVQIREKLVVRQFSDIPVEFTHKADRTTYQLDNYLVSIKTELPYNLADNDARNFQFMATIEADQLPPGRHVLPVKVSSTPPGLNIIEIVPATIIIDISKPKPIMKSKSPSAIPGNGAGDPQAQ